VPSHHADALDDDATLVLEEDLRDLALLALVFAADDLNEVTDLEAIHQSTSGASEMIFMNFFARSSRATGPKMRVPIGSFSLLISTALFRRT
jgi:hypothetical protein